MALGLATVARELCERFAADAPEIPDARGRRCAARGRSPPRSTSSGPSARTTAIPRRSRCAIEPELKLDLPAGFQLGAIGRFRADAFDRLEPGLPRELDVAPVSRPAELGNHAEVELREFFVQGKIGPAWLRAGKQQVVWGQADGLKVLDVVDPQDFREFILPTFEDSRIPLWTLNTEIPIGATQLQLLWIPDPSARSRAAAGRHLRLHARRAWWDRRHRPASRWICAIPTSRAVSTPPTPARDSRPSGTAST